MKVNRSWLFSISFGLMILSYTFYMDFKPAQMQIQKLQIQNTRLQKEMNDNRKFLNSVSAGLTGDAFYAWLQQGFSQLQLQNFSTTSSGLDLKIAGPATTLINLLIAVQESHCTHLVLSDLQTPEAYLEIQFTQIYANPQPLIQPIKQEKMKIADPPVQASFTPTKSKSIGKVKKNGVCWVVNTVGEKTIMRKTNSC